MYATTILETSMMKAWEQAMLFVADSPLKLTFGGGTEVKYARDSQTTIILNENAVQEALAKKWHPSDPFCSKSRIELYIQEYKQGFDANKFDYTYRNILENSFERHTTKNNIQSKIAKLFGFNLSTSESINQLDILRKGLQKQINDQMGSNRNIAVLFNPAKDNFFSKSIPCFNEILIRWESEGYISVHTTFRSHDLATAWNPNMIALTNFIQEEIAKPYDCKIKYWAEHNYSLHIYDYDLHIAHNMIHVYPNPSLSGIHNYLDALTSKYSP